MEWQLKQENGIKYSISIENFDKKMKTFKTGQHISSELFKIGESTFQLEMYPNGYAKKHWNNVSVYLFNRSAWGVKASCKLFINGARGEFSEILEKYYYERNGGFWGFGDFVKHEICTKKDLLDADGTFKLEADIELLGEEVTFSRNVASTDDTKELKLEMDQLKSVIKKDRQAQKKEMDGLKMAMQALTVSMSTDCPMSIDCPICLETVRPPMRLMQCMQGHIICDDCFGKIKTQESMKPCPTCMEPIGGRPSELESLLGLN